ncbi:NAD(P)-dependent oxidoreductase [Rhizobium sp. KVB221]|uniref:NAD(P)-dependent oxidoreductase n=1 Tax=Rhizobium setariae TaxID=2801340 RepID=A0A936YRJ3_9HYPH|nr:NAD(P)-dependent oxidoreductase [Rhizobium setariae]MBL0373271.1 NAD(P)-dependent oxidoreductase [Rhizobium setariae]
MRQAKRLVITGATGFIGGRLLDAALDRGMEVVALARDPGKIQRRDRPGLSIRTWEFGDSLPAVGDADAICHLAATIPRNFEDPGEAARCFEANALSSLSLASQAADQGIGQFVYFSSGQIYSTKATLASEDASTYPMGRATYYLASKLAGELCVQALGKSRGLDVTVLRLASVYGPGMHGRGMLPNFIRRLASGETVTVQNGGAYCVDLVYADDVADLALRAVDMKAAGIFNVGTGEARSSLDVAHAIARIVGADRSLIVVEGTAEPHGFAALDIAKASDMLGYRPARLEDGLAAWERTGQLTNFST